MRAGRRAGAGRGHGASGRMGLWGLAAPLGAEPGRCWSLGFSGAAAEAGRVPGSLDGAAWAPSHKSVLAVWPWGTQRGRPSQGCSGLRLTKACSSPQNADLGGQGGERGSGGQVGGEQRIRAGQLALSTGLLPRRCGPSTPPQSRGSCHLLERKEQKSRGISLFRHLEARLPKHSGEWGVVGGRGQRRASEPTSGIAPSTCPHALSPGWGLPRQGPGSQG